MSTPTTPTRLDTRHLARHARRAIRERLRYPAPEALREVEREDGAVMLRLNSGGNALAVESYLNLRGYVARYAGPNPDGYGCQVRVTVKERPCALVAAVGADRFPCRNHEGGKHHFAAHWPACPAPFCKLPPGHRELHDIPAGQAVVEDTQAAAATLPTQ